MGGGGGAAVRGQRPLAAALPSALRATSVARTQPFRGLSSAAPAAAGGGSGHGGVTSQCSAKAKGPSSLPAMTIEILPRYTCIQSLPTVASRRNGGPVSSRWGNGTLPPAGASRQPAKSRRCGHCSLCTIVARFAFPLAAAPQRRAPLQEPPAAIRSARRSDLRRIDNRLFSCCTGRRQARVAGHHQRRDCPCAAARCVALCRRCTRNCRN